MKTVVVRVGKATFSSDSLPGIPNRWTRNRKIEIAVCIMARLLSRERAYELYNLTAEELRGWMNMNLETVPRFIFRSTSDSAVTA